MTTTNSCLLSIILIISVVSLSDSSLFDIIILCGSSSYVNVHVCDPQALVLNFVLQLFQINLTLGDFNEIYH